LLMGQERLVLSLADVGEGYRGGVARLAFVDQGRKLLAFLSDKGKVVAWETDGPPGSGSVVKSGSWKGEEKELVQELAAGGTFSFGDPGWVDYDIEAEVQRGAVVQPGPKRPSGGFVEVQDGGPLVGLLFRERVEALLGDKSGFWEGGASTGFN